MGSPAAWEDRGHQERANEWRLRLLMAQIPSLHAEARLRIIAIGAHPDDCDGKVAGTAAKFVKAGAAVKFLSVTNGDAGHQSDHGSTLARRRSLPAGWASPNTRS